MRVLSFIALLSAAAAALVDPLVAYGLDASAELRRVDVLGDGKLIKIVLAEGTGAKAVKGAEISAHYVGKLADGAKDFDSSRKRGSPFQFQLGAGRVIKGWDNGFATMAIGEKAILVIDADQGCALHRRESARAPSRCVDPPSPHFVSLQQTALAALAARSLAARRSTSRSSLSRRRARAPRTSKRRSIERCARAGLVCHTLAHTVVPLPPPSTARARASSRRRPRPSRRATPQRMRQRAPRRARAPARPMGPRLAKCRTRALQLAARGAEARAAVAVAAVAAAAETAAATALRR